MSFTKRGPVVFGAATLIATGLTMTTSSSAFAAGSFCTSTPTSGAEACFVKAGDSIQVADKNADDYSAGAVWYQQLYNDNTGQWVEYTEGTCMNSAGANTTKTCKYDFYENTTLNPFGSYGSRVDLRACTFDGSSPIVCGNEAWGLNGG